MSNFSDYQREERPRTEPGNYRVVIVEVEETTAKTSGNPMIVVTVKPSGGDVKVKNYLVKNEYFNRNMTQFFDSFDIEDGDFELLGWIGAEGAARLKENENGYLEVAWFISKQKAEKLPPFEGGRPERQTVTSFQEVADDGDMPF